MEKQVRKYNKLTPAQISAAKRFERKYGISVSQCGKWLDWFFALENGDVTPEFFEKETGLTLPKKEGE